MQLHFPILTCYYFHKPFLLALYFNYPSISFLKMISNPVTFRIFAFTWDNFFDLDPFFLITKRLELDVGDLVKG